MIGLLKRHRDTLLAMLVYALLTVGMTYPIILQMSTHLIGDSTDAYLFFWGNWWTREALRKGLDLYHTDYLFYPSGVSLYFHAFSHANAFLWMVLASLFGAVPAYNLIILISYWLASFNMYLLAKDLGLSNAASFLAGLVYGLSPYHLSNADNLVLVSSQWMPLYALFFLRAVRRGSLRASVLAAIFMALSALSSWHLLTLLSLWTALFLLYSLAFERRMWSRRALWALLVTVLCSALILAPFLFPLVRELLADDKPYVASADGQGNDLLAFLVPGPGHPLLGEALRSLHARLQMLPGKGRRHPAYLGLTMYALALLAVVKKRHQAGFWLAAGVVFAVLSLHSPLTFNGSVLDVVRLPWFQPIVSLMRAAWRFNELFAFCVAVLAALGWDVIQAGLKDSRFASFSSWATGALCVCLLCVYAKLPFPTIKIHVSPFYDRLAREDGDFGIVTVPMGYAEAKRYMFLQTYHGKKLVGGHVSRPPEGAGDFIDTVPILRAMDREGEPPDRAAFGVREQVKELAAHDIRYLILHQDQLSDETLAAWQAYMAVSPIYENPVVYDTGFDFTPRWRPSDDLMILDATWSSSSMVQTEWGELSVTWLADRPPEKDLTVQIVLVDGEGHVARQKSFPIGEQGWPTSKWPEGAVAAYSYPIQIGPFAEPGCYSVSLELVDASTGEPYGEAVKVGEVEVTALPRVFTPPTMTHSISADFGDDLTLLGYDVTQSKEALQLTLHWQAKRRMEAQYKFFVHVYNPDDNSLVTQADFVPRDWTYPTIWWQPDEVVSDEIVLSLDGIAPGGYQLAVGVYDSATGERLPIDDAGALPVFSAALILQEVTVP